MGSPSPNHPSRSLRINSVSSAKTKKSTGSREVLGSSMDFSVNYELRIVSYEYLEQIVSMSAPRLADSHRYFSSSEQSISMRSMWGLISSMLSYEMIYVSQVMSRQIFEIGGILELTTISSSVMHHLSHWVRYSRAFSNSQILIQLSSCSGNHSSKSDENISGERESRKMRRSS